MTIAETATVPSLSIVDLFKNSKPRTKLFVQLIPPGLTEDEFKELIKDYEPQIDYFAFKPGKIIRDSYGHLIGTDCPNYGFAVVNFKNPRTCPKFHREFHHFQLADSYSTLHLSIVMMLKFLDIQSKLFVEFALIQETPKEQSPAEPSEINTKRDHESFRDLQIFKEFLKVFPFAAKIEEERLAAIGPVEIDLDSEEPAEVDIVSPKVNEMDVKLPVQIPEAPQVTFSSLMANSSSSTEAVTPLTEFIKSLSLDKKLPAAKKPKKKADKKKGERKDSETKKGQNEKKKSRRDKQREKQTDADNSKTDLPTKKKFKSKSSTENTSASLVDKPQNAPVIKGVPKILSRKQETFDAPAVAVVPEIFILKPDADDFKPSLVTQFVNADIAHPASVKKQIKPAKTEPVFKSTPIEVASPTETSHLSSIPTKKEKSGKGKTLAERSRPAREPYISPDDSQSIELVRSVINTASTEAKTTDKAVDYNSAVVKHKTSDRANNDKAEKAPQKISIKTKQAKKETPVQDLQKPVETVKEEPKKQVTNVKKQQVKDPQPPKQTTQAKEPKEPKQPNEPKVSKEMKQAELSAPVPPNVVKKVFKTSAKTQTAAKE